MSGQMLPEDRSEIRVVPHARRAVWERHSPPDHLFICNVCPLPVRTHYRNSGIGKRHYALMRERD